MSCLMPSPVVVLSVAHMVKRLAYKQNPKNGRVIVHGNLSRLTVYKLYFYIRIFLTSDFMTSGDLAERLRR